MIGRLSGWKRLRWMKELRAQGSPVDCSLFRRMVCGPGTPAELTLSRAKENVISSIAASRTIGSFATPQRVTTLLELEHCFCATKRVIEKCR